MGRTFACSDLHGMLDLYKQIKEFLQPDDIVYFLGDAGDRGTDCWETVKAILTDPQFICLLGNHEDMLLKCMRTYLKTGMALSRDHELLCSNGGASTFSGWTKEKDLDFWYEKIKALPDVVVYPRRDGKKCVLSHAGCNPYVDEEAPDGMSFGTHEDLIWDRRHYWYAWDDSDLLPDVYVIHGHTPIEYLVEDIHYFDRSSDWFMPKLPIAYWYCNDRKCCIDQGAFYTYCTILLDLDTFEAHGFTTEGYVDGEIAY